MSKSDNNIRSERRKRNKKSKKRKRILFILVPLALLLIGSTVYAVNLVNKAETTAANSYESDGREKSELRDEAVDPSEDHVSILFIGVDDSEHREENNSGASRSDALILATLNKDDSSVKLLSIPRDSYVYIPEVGYEDKITHAHAFGGATATIETVENLLDIPVDYYVRLNFNAFVDVVDELGGITFDVPYEFYESNSADEKNAIHLFAGEQELDGEEALAIARTRKLDNDLERGKRQQEVIKAIANKATSLSSVFKYDNVIEAVGDNMSTSLTFDQMKSFISYGTSGDLDIETLNLTGNDMMLNEIYYFGLDDTVLEENKQILQEHLDLD
ncbi:LCP family protein [Paraliobacillus zengyii]|uniref:LCP family protein n=1 Tax=Paraliobacillus zengyii TaxID=2213194 RepID=UPI000E3E5D3B|nr:LCP family protein [Paraliobacillus zengyii]